jgi:SecD/SecF fusion protein
MMIGVLSGAYSSIFIASPVLTHWKEREPAYRSRRQRLEAEMGFVPTFPEDNVVAKTDGVAAPQAPAAPAPRRTPAVPAPAPPPAALPEPVADDGNGGEPDALDVEPVGTGAGAEPRSDRPSRSERERRRRQQRARRKHGRNR